MRDAVCDACLTLAGCGPNEERGELPLGQTARRATAGWAGDDKRHRSDRRTGGGTVVAESEQVRGQRAASDFNRPITAVPQAAVGSPSMSALQLGRDRHRYGLATTVRCDVNTGPRPVSVSGSANQYAERADVPPCEWIIVARRVVRDTRDGVCVRSRRSDDCRAYRRCLTRGAVDDCNGYCFPQDSVTCARGGSTTDETGSRDEAAQRTSQAHSSDRMKGELAMPMALYRAPRSSRSKPLYARAVFFSESQ